MNEIDKIIGRYERQLKTVNKILDKNTFSSFEKRKKLENRSEFLTELIEELKHLKYD